RAGSRVFQASSAMRTFWAAVSAVNGGSGGRLMRYPSVGGGVMATIAENDQASSHLRPSTEPHHCTASAPLRRAGVTAHPRKSVFGAAARLILGGDPTAIPHGIECGPDRRIIDLALVRLGTRRHGGDLHVADQRQMALDAPDQVALHDLHVIAVELDLDVRP